MGDGGRMDRIPAVIALLISLAGAIILIVGMTREKWLIFKPTTGTSIDYGLIKTCSAGACSDIDFDDIDNPAWIASLALWIISLILIFVGSFFVIFALLGIRTYKMFGAGNKTIYVGFILQAIGLIVFPVGFNDFGEECSKSSGYACGKDVTCEGDSEFDFFTICSPYTFGMDFILGCVGVGAQMVASIIYGCVDSEP